MAIGGAAWLVMMVEMVGHLVGGGMPEMLVGESVQIVGPVADVVGIIDRVLLLLLVDEHPLDNRLWVRLLLRTRMELLLLPESLVLAVQLVQLVPQLLQPGLILLLLQLDQAIVEFGGYFGVLQVFAQFVDLFGEFAYVFVVGLLLLGVGGVVLDCVLVVDFGDVLQNAFESHFALLYFDLLHVEVRVYHIFGV